MSVHRNGDIGVPRVSGHTNSSSASNNPGCLSIAGFSPAPGARTRSITSAPASISDAPFATVGRDTPDSSATRVLPPRPTITAAAPTTNRR